MINNGTEAILCFKFRKLNETSFSLKYHILLKLHEGEFSSYPSLHLEVFSGA